MVDLITVTKAKDTSYLSLLDFLRKIGIFPCKKIIDENSRKAFLKPANGKIQFVIYFVILLFIFVLTAFSQWIIIASLEYESLHETIMEVMKVGTAMHDSDYDFIVALALDVFTWIFHAIIMISLVSSREDLCNVQHYLLEKANYDPKSEMAIHMKSFCNRSLIKSGLGIMVTFVCMAIGNTLNVKQHFQLSLVIILPFALHVFIFCFWALLPIIAFNFYVCEVLLMLIPWTLALREKFVNNARHVMKSHDIEELLEESDRLLVGIDMVSKAMSKTLYWLFTMIMIGAIVGTYLMISFFLSQEEFTMSISLNFVGLGGFVVLYLRFAYNYCTVSQDIKETIHGINKALLNLDINPEQIVTTNGSTIRAKHLQMRIASGFEEFQGFHGNHYFVLDKPLLTSISANYATYLIILIQFKVSELSAK